MPRTALIAIALLALYTALAPLPSQACTTVMIPGSAEKIVAKSYDWDLGNGMALVNKRHVAKTALAALPGDHPAQWTSTYGSVTFNQHGRELPVSGMNEAGLVVEIMWLDSSVYP